MLSAGQLPIMTCILTYGVKMGLLQWESVPKV
jgi:hypothetical protein